MYILRICEQPSETSEPAITWSFLKWHGKYLRAHTHAGRVSSRAVSGAQGGAEGGAVRAEWMRRHTRA